MGGVSQGGGAPPTCPHARTATATIPVRGGRRPLGGVSLCKPQALVAPSPPPHLPAAAQPARAPRPAAPATLPRRSHCGRVIGPGRPLAGRPAAHVGDDDGSRGQLTATLRRRRVTRPARQTAASVVIVGAGGTCHGGGSQARRGGGSPRVSAAETRRGRGRVAARRQHVATRDRWPSGQRCLVRAGGRRRRRPPGTPQSCSGGRTGAARRVRKGSRAREEQPPIPLFVTPALATSAGQTLRPGTRFPHPHVL